MAMQNHTDDRAKIIATRINDKREDFRQDRFTDAQNDILITFFDLSQEFPDISDVYILTVSALQQHMEVVSKLYVVNKKGQLDLVQASDKLLNKPMPAPDGITIKPSLINEGNRLLFPLVNIGSDGRVGPEIGVFEVVSTQGFSNQEIFFLGKFVNRVGAVLSVRAKDQQRIAHIEFVNSLVADIEHNVIIPNMYFKHLFNKLRKKISDMAELGDFIQVMKQSTMFENKSCDLVLNKITTLHGSFIEYHVEMQKHHDSCSLFLESLFRRDHFRKGQLVLKPSKCYVEKEIINPQLANYEKRLVHQGISIQKPADMIDEEIPLNVDIGLLAQVYANLFSNAVKYSEPITLPDGRVRKFVAYGREHIKDCFGQGQDAVKFNVFTTGSHLSVDDAERIYEEGFRGANSVKQAGMGHGLTFIRQVVEIHGGQVSYETTEYGNNFCFSLPVRSDFDPQ